MLEHTVTFLFVRHRALDLPSHGISAAAIGPPIVESLWDTPEYERYFQQMGQQGWELVSVTPLISGSEINTRTDGYYFFWKRPT